MAKRGRGRPIDYRAYQKAYTALKKEMAKNGYTMYQRRLTALEYRTLYKAYKNTRKNEISQGKRKTLGNISRDILKSQQYEYSSKQAKVFQTAIKTQTGKTPSIKDIRAKKVQVDWNAISLREKELRDQGWGWSRVHIQIAEEFFGS